MSAIFFPLITDNVFGEFWDFRPFTHAFKTLCGLADPKEYRKSMFREYSGLSLQINEKFMINDWRELTSFGRISDAVIISTPDRLHAEIAVNCSNLGYHILLEKPMATTEQDCKDIVSTVKSNNSILAVCHVLRYTPYSRKMKEIVNSG